MPKTLSKDESTVTPTYTRFTAEPFEAGYGHTVGNSLRRVLLSSLEGAAITAVRVNGRPARVHRAARRRRGYDRHHPQPQEDQVQSQRPRDPQLDPEHQQGRRDHRRRHPVHQPVRGAQSRAAHLHGRQEAEVRRRVRGARRPRLRHGRGKQASRPAHRPHPHRLDLFAGDEGQILRRGHPRRPAHGLRQARASTCTPTAGSTRARRCSRRARSCATTSTCSSTTTRTSSSST